MRRWIKIGLPLFVVLPGFPLLLIILALISLIGFGPALFVIGLTLHNWYYAFPAAIFGKELFPSAEFGYLPTAGGYLLAGVLYTIIATVLLLIILRTIGRTNIIKK